MPNGKDQVRRYHSVDQESVNRCEIGIKTLPECMKCDYFRGWRRRKTGILCSYLSPETEKAVSSMKKALSEHVCPNCGSALRDQRLTSGIHRGHGAIYCTKPFCDFIIMI